MRVLEMYEQNSCRIYHQNLLSYLAGYSPLCPQYVAHVISEASDMPYAASEDLAVRHRTIYRAAERKIDNTLANLSKTAAGLILGVFNNQLSDVKHSVRHLLFKIIRHYIDFGFVLTLRGSHGIHLYHPNSSFVFEDEDGQIFFAADRKKEGKELRTVFDFSNHIYYEYHDSKFKKKTNFNKDDYLMSTVNPISSGMISIESQVLINYYQFLIVGDVNHLVYPPLSIVEGAPSTGVGKLFPGAVNERTEEGQPFLCSPTYQKQAASSLLLENIQALQAIITNNYNIEILRQDPTSLEVVHTMAGYLTKVLKMHRINVTLQVPPSNNELTQDSNLLKLLQEISSMDAMASQQFNSRPLLEKIFEKYGLSDALLSKAATAQKMAALQQAQSQAQSQAQAQSQTPNQQ